MACADIGDSSAPLEMSAVRGWQLSPEACGDRYMAEIKAKKKGIVLLHDIHAKTQLMVKYLVPKLKAEGYTFVRLDQIQGLRPTQ